MSRSIGRAALLVSVGVLLSRVLGYARTLVLGSLLGVGAESALYATAFTLPDILFFLMAGGYLSITLVPLLAGHLEAGDRHAAGRAFTAVFRVVVGLMVVLTAVLVAAAEPVTAAVFPEIGGADLDRLTGMMRVTFGSQVFFLAGTLFMAVQYAHKRFLVPTMAPLIYNIGIIAGGLVGAIGGEPRPEAFIWGGFVGAGIGNFALQAWGARRAGVWFEAGTPWGGRPLRDYFALALPLMIGQSAVALDESWPRIFGQFAGTEAISRLFFARTLNMLPVGMIAQAAGVAAYPFLAGLVASGSLDQYRATVIRSVRASIAVAGAAAAVVIPLAGPIVATAFQYGEFDAADTASVGPLLAIYAVSIPFWAAHQVYTRSFYAQRRMWTPVVIGTAVTTVVVPVLWFGVQRWGAAGVAGGSTFGVALYTAAIGLAWHRSEGGLADVGAVVTRALAATLVAAAATLGVAALAADLVPIGRGVVAAPVGIVVYLVAGRLLGLEEIEAVIRRLRRDRRT